LNDYFQAVHIEKCARATFVDIEMMVGIDVIDVEIEEFQPQGDYFGSRLEHLFPGKDFVVVADEADAERVMILTSQMRS